MGQSTGERKGSIDGQEGLARWLDTLPVGTYVPARSLRRFRWPIAEDTTVWLTVGCCATFTDLEYAGWFKALPKHGVLVDSADPRFRRLLDRVEAGV